MPNHVVNQVYINDVESKTKFAEIAEFVKSDTTLFDFAKLVPEPSDNDDWYDWRCTNWGTKWNAYEIVCNPYRTMFEMWTAWTTPFQVMVALSAKFPEVLVTVDFADEDLGSGNCGSYSIKGGELIEFVDCDAEFSCKLWGIDYQEYMEEEKFCIDQDQ